MMQCKSKEGGLVYFYVFGMSLSLIIPPLFIKTLPSTPHNSTCSQEAETEMTKCLFCFGSIFLLARGKCFLAFTVLHEIPDDIGKCTIMVN